MGAIPPPSLPPYKSNLYIITYEQLKKILSKSGEVERHSTPTSPTPPPLFNVPAFVIVPYYNRLSSIFNIHSHLKCVLQLNIVHMFINNNVSFGMVFFCKCVREFGKVWAFARAEFGIICMNK